MTMARDFSVDTLRQPASPASLASWYTQGVSDEFGDRLLMFDNTGGASLELLRFRDALSANPAFEEALRKRTRRLRDFRHPAFATVRGVEWLHPDDGLALVSDHTPGRRLSEVLQHTRGAGFAVALIRQLAPALAALERAGDGVGHGALTPGRIVLGPNGRLMIGEHVLGAALAQLQMAPDRLASEFGILLPPRGPAGNDLDGRTDCFQLALIALSVIRGRVLTATEYPDEMSRLLDNPLPDGGSATGRGASWLQVWLRRALQIGGRPFDSSADALEALRVISDTPDEIVAPEGMPNTFEPANRRALEGSVSTSHDEPPPDVIDVVARYPPNAPDDAPIPFPPARSDALADHFSSEDAAGAKHPSVESKSPEVPSAGRARPWLQVLVASLLLVAIGEALFIARLMFGPESAPAPATVVEASSANTPAPPPVDPPAAPRTETEQKPPVSRAAASAVAPVRPAPHATGDPKDGVPGSSPQPRQPMGAIKFEAPIALEVYEGDRRLGSTATGIVSAAAGRRELELVNSVLGFRVRQVVEVHADRVVPVRVSPPNGLVSINAVPWANVSIDGVAVGETPLGNLSVPLGEREILFQHPQLGTQRQRVVVRLDGTTRVTANLQR